VRARTHSACHRPGLAASVDRRGAGAAPDSGHGDRPVRAEGDGADSIGAANRRSRGSRTRRDRRTGELFSRSFMPTSRSMVPICAAVAALSVLSAANADTNADAFVAHQAATRSFE